jgi:TIR domain-containing protein
MQGIFISYRRADSAADMTDRVYEHLVRRWQGCVFMDIDSLKAGDLFAKAIEQSLQNCAVMLVMIGHYWASLTDEQGARRIDNPGDYPRMEVAAALKRGIRVIPVLVGNTPLPKREELPRDIAGLLDRQVLRLSREEFDADMERLISSVAQELPRKTWTEMPLQTLAVAVVLLLFGILAYFTLGHRLFPQKSPTKDSSSSKNVAESAVPSIDRKHRVDTPQTIDAGTAPQGSIPSTGVLNISGKWRTARIQNVYSPDEASTIVFEFTQSGDTVMGTVTETTDEVRNTTGIVDGKIRDTVVSFYTNGETTWESGNTIPYKEMYIGVLQKAGREIAFRRFDDVPSGGEVERFVASPK